MWTMDSFMNRAAIHNMNRLSNWFSFDFHPQLIKLAALHQVWHFYFLHHVPAKSCCRCRCHWTRPSFVAWAVADDFRIHRFRPDAAGAFHLQLEGKENHRCGSQLRPRCRRRCSFHFRLHRGDHQNASVCKSSGYLCNGTTWEFDGTEMFSLHFQKCSKHKWRCTCSESSMLMLSSMVHDALCIADGMTYSFSGYKTFLHIDAHYVFGAGWSIILSLDVSWK